MTRTAAEYELIQKKTFTSWVNAKIKGRGRVEDITKDLGDGTWLVHLAEALTGVSIKMPAVKPNTKMTGFQVIENVESALKVFRSQGLRITVNSNDFITSRTPQILGFVFTLINKFGNISTNESLLQSITDCVSKFGINIESLAPEVFSDGMVFCGIVSKAIPSAFDFKNLRPENRRENVTLAFEVAEKELQVPKILDVEDVISGVVDRDSIVAYLSGFNLEGIADGTVIIDVEPGKYDGAYDFTAVDDAQETEVVVESEIEKLLKELREEKTQRERSDKSVEFLEAELKREREMRVEKEKKEESETQKTIERLEVELKIERETKGLELESLREQLQKERESNSKVQSEQKAAQDTISKLESEVALLNSSRLAMEERLKLATSVGGDLSSERVEREKLVTQLSEEKSLSRKTLEELKAEKKETEKLKKQVEDIIKEKEGAVKLIKNKEVEIENMLKLQNEQNQTLSNMRKSLEAAQLTISNLESKSKENGKSESKELSSLKERLSETEKSLDKMREYKEKLITTQSELDSYRRKTGEDIAEAKAEQTRLVTKIKKIEILVEKYRVRKNYYRKVIKKYLIEDDGTNNPKDQLVFKIKEKGKGKSWEKEKEKLKKEIAVRGKGRHSDSFSESGSESDTSHDRTKSRSHGSDS